MPEASSFCVNEEYMNLMPCDHLVSADFSVRAALFLLT
jgi:hypothetical protein